jgi:chitodextrinase
MVSYSGYVYKANWWTKGNNPASNNGGSGSGEEWLKIGACQ